jgi:hypothetical protein
MLQDHSSVVGGHQNLDTLVKNHHAVTVRCPASTVSFQPCNLARLIAPTSVVPTPRTSLSDSRRLLTSRAAARGRSTVTALGARSRADMGRPWAILATGLGQQCGPLIENGPAVHRLILVFHFLL